MKSALRLLCIVVSLFAGSITQAQPLAYPNRPIRLIVPYGPAGTTDLLARIISEKVTPNWGQPVIVENRAGGNGLIGTEAVARAAPDGHTIVLVVSNHVTYEFLNRKLPFDPLKDFEPVVYLATTPIVLVAHPSFPVPANDVKQFIAYAKSNQPVNYALSGRGQESQLIMEMLSQAAGLKWNTIVYKGGSPAMQDVVAGHVPITPGVIGTASSFLRAGRVKPIFVSSARRQSSLPDTPTLAESGYPDLVIQVWWGLLAPAGTPSQIVKQLNAEINRIFNLPDVKERLAKVDVEYIGGTPEEFGKVMREDSRKLGNVMKAAGIGPE